MWKFHGRPRFPRFRKLAGFFMIKKNNLILFDHQNLNPLKGIRAASPNYPNHELIFWILGLFYGASLASRNEFESLKMIRIRSEFESLKMIRIRSEFQLNNPCNDGLHRARLPAALLFFHPSFLINFYHLDFPNLFHTYWFIGFLENHLIEVALHSVGNTKGIPIGRSAARLRHFIDLELHLNNRINENRSYDYNPRLIINSNQKALKSCALPLKNDLGHSQCITIHDLFLFNTLFKGAKQRVCLHTRCFAGKIINHPFDGNGGNLPPHPSILIAKLNFGSS